MASNSYSPTGWPTPHRRPPAYTPPQVVRVYRSPRRSGESLLKTLFALGMLGAVLFAFLIAALTVGFYAYFQVTDRIVPGVTVGGLDLGGMKPEEAYAAIQSIPVQSGLIVATDGRQSLTLTAAELGYGIDAAGTALQAHAVGHNGAILDEAAQMATALWDGRPVEPRVLLDPAAARLRLEKLASGLSLPARDASVGMQNGALVAIPAQTGYVLDVEATLAGLITHSEQVFQEQSLPIVTRTVAPRVTDVTPALAEAERLLSTPLTVAAYDPITNEHFQWSPPRETVAAWLTVSPGEAGPRVALDPALVRAYLDSLNATLGGERYLEVTQDAAGLAAAAQAGQPVIAGVRHRPTTYVVKPGDTLLKIGWNLGMPYWRIQQANPDVDPNNLWAGMSLTIPSKDELLPLPVIPNKRIVISISGQRLWVYQNGEVVREEVISTGIDRSPTQPGIFQVQTHDPNAYASVWDLYMPNWLGIYEAWPGFMNGIHGLPLLSNGRRLWASNLGRPASYGCIILDLPAAEWLYNWAENGVIVEIKP